MSSLVRKFKRNIRRLTADLGNSGWKATNGTDEICIPHALLQITPGQFNDAIKIANGTPGPDIIQVGGVPYVVGESAERYGIITKPEINARYRQGYIDVAMAAMMARLWKTSGDIVVYLAYPPGSIDYSDMLLGALKEEYTVWCEGRECTYRLMWANAFPEPVGGIMNVMLSDDGCRYKNPHLKDSHVLSIDFGGGTIDFAALLPDGAVDTSIHNSVETGINDVYAFIEKELKQQNPKAFIGVKGKLPPDRMRTALKTGVYPHKGIDIPCHDIKEVALNRMLNRFVDGYNSIAKGGSQSDDIVLTGAGYVDIHDRVVEATGFNADRVWVSEEPAYAHFANMRGGGKQLLMYESMGLVTYE